MYRHSNRQTPRLICALVVICLSVSCSISQACDEALAEKLLANNQQYEAFQVLLPCESSDGASASALFALAGLYSDAEISGVEDAVERGHKVWELMEKAALTGEEDVVITLATMYDLGDSELGYAEEPLVADCLFALTGGPNGTNPMPPITREAVMKCISTDFSKVDD